MPRRTTITLDEDVSALLEKESRRKGVPADEVVNEALRRVLEARKPFVVEPFDLGAPKIDVTCTGAALAALDEIETSDEMHRK